MKSLILTLFDYFSKHRLVFWVTMLTFFVLFTALAFRVSFEEDISKMLQMDKKTSEYNKLIQNTHLVDKLVIYISDNRPALSSDQIKMAYCDSLLIRINTLDSNLIKKDFVRQKEFPFIEVYKALLKNLPFFIEEQDYLSFDSILNPENIQHHLYENKKFLSTPAGGLIRQIIPWDPAGISYPLLLRLEKLEDATGYKMINGYFFSKDKKNLVLFIDPVNPANETGKNTVLINSLNRFVSELKEYEQFNNIECNFIGATVISVENARQIRYDAAITIAGMFVVLIILITSVFRKKRSLFLIFSPIIFGIVFALGFISFIKPSISFIAIGATSVLLGIAVNYPLHILTYRLHERDLRKIIGDMVKPMTIGSATTIGGFVCLFFVNAEILRDFGLLGALGLIGAVLFSLIFLPHLIGQQDFEGKPVEKWLEKAGRIQLENNPYIIWSVILLTPVLLYFSFNVEFDCDLMHLNYMSSRQKKAEQILRLDDSLIYSAYVISYGNNLDQALTSAGRIKKLSDSLSLAGIANKYIGVIDFLPSENEQGIRIKRWKNYFTRERILEIRESINQSSSNLGFKENTFDNFYSVLDAKTEKIDTADFIFLKDIVANETITVAPDITTIVSVLKIPPAKREEVYNRISNLPGTEIMDRKSLSSQMASIINDDFDFIAIFSALMVFIALLLTYGRIELAITAFLPMVVSWIWILGFMSLLDLKFNIVNIILAAFIFGLGDDYCIFTMDGLLREYRVKKKHMPVIRISILLSGLTTVIGFGLMLFAKHPALQSIGLISVIGIISVLFISQVLEPYLFRIFVSSPVRKGFAPISLTMVLKSLFAYSVSILGCILLSIIGFVLLVINPFYRQKSRLIFNTIISKAAWTLLYIMSNVKKRLIFDQKPDFSRPCVFVANHQSTIDILSMIMLSPKIILLTNKWVWKSPLFGYIVRLAGYYPIFEGVIPSINTLRLKIAEGYSLALFPEGTRSKDGKIGRFHKGAFYIAQQLGVDIIPVLVHGTRNCISKGSFVVRDTTFTIKVLARIKQTVTKYGGSYQEKTKLVRNLLIKQYAILDEELLTPDFQYKRVVDNFLFKGPLLEWYMKVKLRMEGNYKVFHELVPHDGIIIDVGCGYGFLDYMLAYLSSRRKIIGIDYDNEKIEVAENGFDKPANLQFIHANIIEFPVSEANCVIFSDVLHYLDEQERARIFLDYASRILPGGMIIVRDGDNNLGKKHTVTQFTEFFSTKVFNFNKTKHKLAFFSVDELVRLGENLGFGSKIIHHQKWTSNLIIVFKKKCDVQ